MLDKLAPIYINTIFADKELAGQIDNIVIQGHTDSQMFAGVNSKDQQFMRNMDLSLKGQMLLLSISSIPDMIKIC